jgi:hypothetical protein
MGQQSSCNESDKEPARRLFSAIGREPPDLSGKERSALAAADRLSRAVFPSASDAPAKADARLVAQMTRALGARENLAKGKDVVRALEADAASADVQKSSLSR